MTPYFRCCEIGDDGRSDPRTARRTKVQRPVRPMLVVMQGVLVQDRVQVLWPSDQHPVGDLGPGCLHPAFGIGVAPHRQLHPIQMTGTEGCG